MGVRPRLLRVPRGLMILGVAALALALTGCTTMQNPFQKASTPPPAELPPGAGPPPGEPGPPPPEPGLALSPTQRFADVPLPQGVKEDPDKTFVYEDQNIQVGRMVYTTRASVNELAQFYINEAPAGGWKLINNVQAAGQELFYVKPGKKLTVIVRDLGPAKGRQLWLTVTPDGAQ